MKAILISIKPKWYAKILNGEKTIEIRKNKALANAIRELIKQYGKALIYMYCSKDKKFPLVLSSDGESFQEYCNAKYYPPFIRGDVLNGKVVARFWCDKVEHFEYETCSRDISGYWLDNGEIFKNKKTCLTGDELWNYIESGDGYAIHISKLEIFDKPKELSEFLIKDNSRKPEKFVAGNSKWEEYYVKKLTKAPQNYCYIEEMVQ